MKLKIKEITGEYIKQMEEERQQKVVF